MFRVSQIFDWIRYTIRQSNPIHSIPPSSPPSLSLTTISHKTPSHVPSPPPLSPPPQTRPSSPAARRYTPPLLPSPRPAPTLPANPRARSAANASLSLGIVAPPPVSVLMLRKSRTEAPMCRLGRAVISDRRGWHFRLVLRLHLQTQRRLARFPTKGNHRVAGFRSSARRLRGWSGEEFCVWGNSRAWIWRQGWAGWRRAGAGAGGRGCLGRWGKGGGLCIGIRRKGGGRWASRGGARGWRRGG